jgi:hypothetical protein
MATPNVVPRADQEGGLGTAAKSWGKLFIENPTAGGTAAATISNLDVDQVALDINAENTTANIIDIDAQDLTTGSVIKIDSNSLNDNGSMFYADVDYVGNVDGASRKMIILDIDKSGNVGSGDTEYAYGSHIDFLDSGTNVGTSNFYGYYVKMQDTNTDGGNNRFGVYVTSSNTDSATTFGLYSRLTDGSEDIRLVSQTNALDYFSIKTGVDGETTMTTVENGVGSTAHLNMVIDGNIDIDSAASITIDAVTDITVTAADNATLTAADNTTVSTTSADGLLTISSAHTAGQAIHIDGDAASDSTVDIDAGILDIDAQTDIAITAGGTLSLSYGTAMVFNEDGADADFRIESDDETHMFFLDAGNNRISIGDSTDAPAATLEVNQASDAGCPLMQLTHTDEDQIALDINSTATTGNVIDVTANTLTTGVITEFNIANSEAGNLSNLNGVFGDWNYTKSGDTGDGNIHRYVGLDMNLGDTASSNHANSTVSQTGVEVAVDSQNNNGNNTNTCLYLRATDATNNYGIDVAATDGAGADIIIKSSAAPGDYATIAVGAEGATTITTVDADTTAAHFEVAADGNIILDAAGTITFEQGANSASMPASNGKVVVQTTTMKVMPDKFFPNGDSGRPAFIADQQTNKLGIHQFDTNDELYALVEIPFGHTVTEVHVYCSDTVTNGVTVGAYNYQTGADNNVTTTTGNTNADIALSSNTIAGGATQDLWIKVELGAADKYLWGAKVTLAVT